jgi:hypothetical protein
MRHRSIDTIGPGHFANKSLLKREREREKKRGGMGVEESEERKKEWKRKKLK